MTPSEIMRDLARNDIFPKMAMIAAGANRETMVPIFVDLVNRLGAQPIPDMKDDEVIALIPIFHMLGEWREPCAYRPLVHLLRRPTEILDHLLGDAITETSFRVMAGTFDADLQPLIEAIEDPNADEFARSSLMSALVLLTQLQPDYSASIEDYFRTFRSRCPEVPLEMLTSWVDAIADLGLEDMSEDVRAVFDDKLIPEDYSNFGHFLGDIQATRDEGGIPKNRRYRKSLIADAVHELSKWHCYSEEFFANQKKRKVNNKFRVAPWTETFMFPKDKVGRNDPCPCGSGKKFKKCCLH